MTASSNVHDLACQQNNDACQPAGHSAVWLQFIPHAKVSAYAALGWQATDGLSTTHHGIYAIIMKWVGEGVPPQC